MYDHKLHPYNGLEQEPDPEEVANSVMGAIFGYAIGSTLCYSFQGRLPNTNPRFRGYTGGGPERLEPGEMDKTTCKALKILRTTLTGGAFGDEVRSVISPGYCGTPTDLMEESHRWMLVNKAENQEEVLGLVLGPVILFQPDRALTVARMAQNHPVTDAVVWDYLVTMKVAITQRRVYDGSTYFGGPVRSFVPPDGKLISTFNNSVQYMRHGLPFVRTMELICGRGGNTTVTGGVTGALLGAIYGVREIPIEYVNNLKDFLDLKELGLAAAKQITGV